jgi:hypothetical protein
LEGPLRGFHRRWGQSFQECVGYGLIDLYAADSEIVHAATLDDILARAMIARGSAGQATRRNDEYEKAGLGGGNFGYQT